MKAGSAVIIPACFLLYLWDNGSAMSAKTEYWLELCDDDLLTAKALFESKRYLHMGFFCHMIAEKALKAVVAHKTNELPPRIHDLDKLAVLGGISESLSEEQLALLDKLGPLQIETRYPEYKEGVVATLSPPHYEKLLNETEEFLCWIKQQLEK
jgi:HEPN domain-containing protein